MNTSGMLKTFYYQRPNMIKLLDSMTSASKKDRFRLVVFKCFCLNECHRQ